MENSVSTTQTFGAVSSKTAMREHEGGKAPKEKERIARRNLYAEGDTVRSA